MEIVVLIVKVAVHVAIGEHAPVPRVEAVELRGGPQKNRGKKFVLSSGGDLGNPCIQCGGNIALIGPLVVVVVNLHSIPFSNAAQITEGLYYLPVILLYRPDMYFNASVPDDALYGFVERKFFDAGDLERPKYHVVGDQFKIIPLKKGYVFG